MNSVNYLASATAGGSDLFGSLGLDWKLLVMQTVAFILLLLVFKKWVYPPILAMLDKRDADIREGLEAATKAKQAANDTEMRTMELMQQARQESRDIVASARTEAAELVANARQDAEVQAERIIQAGRQETQAELAKAKRDLQSEMVSLVVEATRTVTAETVDAAKDKALIRKRLDDLQKETV